MDVIRINVNKQLDGYTFSTTPFIRELIKKLFPDSHPANNIFIAYDTKSDFELYVGNLENYIFPVLLGIDNKMDLEKIKQIEYVDTQTGKTHKVTPSLD
ncbi:MAG: hypothetical protein WKG06_39935 [Segetibacter sp.]